MEDKDTLYARWLSGQVSDNELEQLKSSGELNELEAIIKAADSLKLPALNKNATFESIKRKKGPKTATLRPINRLSWAIGIAAAILIAAGAYLILLNRPTNISAPFAENTNFAFSDNSTVILNDGSSLKFDENAWPDQRIINLTGEGYFEVQKGNPFIIETANGLVEVLGTKFNVRAWGANLYVECYEGKVAVQSESEIMEVPAAFAINVIDGKMGEIFAINHEQPYWTQGESRFYDEDLDVIFEEFERQFAIEAKFPSINRKLSGIFTHESPDSALFMICAPLGLNYTLDIDKGIATISE